MTVTTGNRDDREYDVFLARIQARLPNAPLLTTDTPDLYDAFLNALPQSERQYHNCHACRRFVNAFGGLITVEDDGTARPALWDEADAPELYQASVRAVIQTIKKARTTGVFYSEQPVWGTPVTGPWHHLSATPHRAMIFNRLTLTPAQYMAEKHEDYGTLCRALAEFTEPMLQSAVTLLKTESLYRSEKCLGVAEWLLALVQARAATRNKQKRDNLTWKAVATAPAGFCHVRSSMIGTLLEDIATGMDFPEVSRRFAAKMHPLQYQRPQAAPTAGNIAQAEKIVAQLQAANALARRFARLEDIQALWMPTPPKDAPHSGGVFSHLQPKDGAAVPSLVPPALTITWEKFARTVLPTADAVALLAPARGSYAALVTAVDADAPPILQWDSAEQRNPVSWYLYSGGSNAGDWGIVAGRHHPVTAVTLQPSMWGGEFAHQGKGVLFVLAGAHDKRSVGSALFPEILKAEFHAIRATIEAYSRSAAIADREEASACGLLLQANNTPWNTVVRVTTKGVTVDYRLDRWD